MIDSIQLLVEMDKKDIAYLVGLMESYDEFAVVRTVDQSRGIIELICSPDYVREVRHLLDSLKDEMNLRVLDEPKTLNHEIHEKHENGVGMGKGLEREP